MLFYHFGFPPHGPSRPGKRLRPRLLLQVATAEGADVDDALDAAVAVEVLHNYSLVHDDIEDRDEMRRGRTTLWARYGVAQAINAGDAMCAISFLSLAAARARLSAPVVLAMIVALHEAHGVMCAGQAEDLHFERERSVDMPAYERMIANKTAALFAVCCELGAHCGGADAAALQRYREVGQSFGLAFQIRDDMLGIWATPERTGKITGVDIERRKWTYPIVWALTQPPSPAREVVAQSYARGEALEPGSVERVVAALDELGAQEAARRAVAEHLRVVESRSDGIVRDFLIESLDLAVS
jgi:geranylgeranyl diphosphate synthase, type I